MNNDDKITLQPGESSALPGFELTAGVKTTIRNPNPANTRFELTTVGGTFISFPVPAFGSFEITPGDDIIRADLHIDSFSPLGPRSSEMD